MSGGIIGTCGKADLNRLDRCGRIVYNSFIVNTKRKSQNLQRFGGNQSPNPVHYPGRCYSFEINIGCTELANAIKPPWYFVQSMKNHGGLDE